VEPFHPLRVRQQEASEEHLAAFQAVGKQSHHQGKSFLHREARKPTVKEGLRAAFPAEGKQSHHQGKPFHHPEAQQPAAKEELKALFSAVDRPRQEG
jgi:hypothetical protein